MSAPYRTGTVRVIKPGVPGSRAVVARGKPIGDAGERFSARIVLILILGSSALSLYDAHLLHGLLGR